MSYRDDTEVVRAENARLRAELAAMREPRRSTRWTADSPAAAGLAPIPLFGAVMWSLEYVSHGWTPEVERGAAVLFADSFDGEKAAGSWEFADLNDVLPEERAAWVVQDGRLAQNGTVIPQSPKSHETAAFVGDASWTDYTVSAKVYDQINGSFGLIARRNGNSFYRYTVIADFYEGGPKHLLEKVVDGVATPLASIDAPGYEQRRWYTVSMSVSGQEIRVWLDGKLVATATDATLASGQAGLYTRAIGNIFFDDVAVTK